MTNSLDKTTKISYEKLLKEYASKGIPAAGNAEKAMEGPQVSTLMRNEPNLLKVVIVNLLHQVQKSPNKMLIQVQAQEIIKRYWYFRLPELQMILKKGLAGYYGNVPGGGDPVLYWLQKYDTEERMDFVESQAARYKEPFEKELEQARIKAIRKAGTIIKKEERG